MRHVTCDMWHNYKYSLLSKDIKTKVVQHVPRINISILHMTCDMRNVTCYMWHAKCDMWHNYKYSLLSIDMKTKVVQHVPRINISIWHMTCDMRNVTCDMQNVTCDIITNTHFWAYTWKQKLFSMSQEPVFIQTRASLVEWLSSAARLDLCAY